MAATATTPKTYHVSVTINLKRGKEEVEFARTETDRLYTLINDAKEVEWAKNRIATIHELIFLPPADKIKDELQRKLAEDDGD